MKHYTHYFRYAMAGLGLAGALLVVGASSTAKAQERDPFRKPTGPARSKFSKPNPTANNVPSIQERVERYKAQKMAAMNAQRPAPKPTTALLVSEMQVTGIFRTPRGYAAMVEATPIKLSYVIYPGEVFYDGQLVAIEETRLVFRRETRLSDGKKTMSVETKPLRVANAVMDSMTAQRTANTAQPDAAKGDANVKVADKP